MRAGVTAIRPPCLGVPMGTFRRLHARLHDARCERLQEYGPRHVFELMAAFPLLVGAAALVLEERPVTSGHAPGGKAAPLPPPAGDAAAPEAPGGLRRHAAAVWEAMRRPDVCMPLAFLLMLSATPSADTAMFSYQTEVLGFTPGFLGQVRWGGGRRGRGGRREGGGRRARRVSCARRSRAARRSERSATLASPEPLLTTSDAPRAPRPYFLSNLCGGSQVQLAAACASFVGVVLYNAALKDVPVRRNRRTLSLSPPLSPCLVAPQRGNLPRKPSSSLSSSSLRGIHGVTVLQPARSPPSDAACVRQLASCEGGVQTACCACCVCAAPQVRSMMLWGTLLAAALQGSQLVLVSGVHRAWGLDDHMFVLGGSLVLDVVQNVSGGGGLLEGGRAFFFYGHGGRERERVRSLEGSLPAAPLAGTREA